jgi:hypothetical protein
MGAGRHNSGEMSNSMRKKHAPERRSAMDHVIFYAGGQRNSGG